jgi:dihydrofolate reductase
MGRLVVSEFITLDGVIEDPGGSEGTANGGWSFRFPAPEGQLFKFEELQAADAQVLGRVTYEGFASVWPTMEGTGEFGEKMNSMPKYVVSTTLTEAPWQNSTIVRDVAEVAEIKQRYAGDVLVAGSATLVAALRAAGLVDEYRLMVHPVVLGGGKRLFAEGGLGDLALVEARPVGPDVLLLTYRPA